MVGLKTNITSNSNQLNIPIPDELKGIELQVIILPADNTSSQIEFFTDVELQTLPSVNLGNDLADTEDYAKW